MEDDIGDMESICLAVSMDGSIDTVDTVDMATIIAMDTTIGIIIRIPTLVTNIMDLMDLMDLMDIMELTNIRLDISELHPLVPDRGQVVITGVKCRHVILDHRPDLA